jgi:hypothetical protein
MGVVNMMMWKTRQARAIRQRPRNPTGVGQTAAQFQAQMVATANLANAIRADPSGQGPGVQAALAQVQATNAAIGAAAAAGSPAMPSSSSSSSSTPYIVAGVVGVAVLGGLIWFATD